MLHNSFAKFGKTVSPASQWQISQKIMPQTKHIALKYHHLKRYVESGEIKINYIHTERQQAGILTKPVWKDLFPKLRSMLMGW